jgi:raffinose/stachyose/melibiose transport system substrate-binding protein
VFHFLSLPGQGFDSNKEETMKLRLWGIPVVTVAILLVVACAPVAAPLPQATSAPAAATAAPPAATSAPAESKLTVWYLSESPDEIQMIQGLVDKFEASRPGLTIDFQPYGFEDMIKAAKLACDTGTMPDVSHGNSGPDYHLAYAKAGCIIDLTDAMKERGWDQRHPREMLYYNEEDPNGPLYGVPYEVVTIGVYYNKDIFEQYNLEVPETWEEFEQVLATLKENGVTPFSVAGTTSALGHYFLAVEHVTVPIEQLRKLFKIQPGVSLLEEGFVESAAKVREWGDKGYFYEGFMGASGQDQTALFCGGDAAMTIAGTWNNFTFLNQCDFEVGLFALPARDDQTPWHSVTTPNNTWQVSSTSQVPDIALDFVDFMMGEEYAKASWNAGGIPTYGFDTPPEPTSDLQLDVYNLTQRPGSIGYYWFSTENVLRERRAAYQLLMSGELTPEEAMGQIEKAWVQDLADRQ